MRTIIIASLLSVALATAPVQAKEPEPVQGDLTIIALMVGMVISAVGLGWYAHDVASGYEARNGIRKNCRAVSDTEVTCDLAALAEQEGVKCQPAGPGKLRCTASERIVNMLRK